MQVNNNNNPNKTVNGLHNVNTQPTRDLIQSQGIRIQHSNYPMPVQKVSPSKTKQVWINILDLLKCKLVLPSHSVIESPGATHNK